MLKSLLGLFVKDVVEGAGRDLIKREAVAQMSEGVRREFLRHVAEGFTREAEFNFSQYVRSVGQMGVEIESEDMEGEKLFLRIQSALQRLEVELEEQGPDSPVAQFLIRKYGGQSSALYVGLEATPIYSTLTRPADRYSGMPWLNRVENDPSINDLIAEEASRILEKLLSNTSPPF